MTMTINRRIAIAAAMGAAMALGAAMTAPVALAQGKTVIRFSAASPPSDFLSKALEVFKEEVQKADPSIEVQTYPNSTLFRQGTEVPAIQRGNLEMSMMQTFEVSAQIPELGFLNRAYLFRDYDHMMKVMNGPVGQRAGALMAEKMGIVALSPIYLGTRTLNLRTIREVNGPGDLAGLKLRMPASPEWLLLGQTLNVTPTPLAMQEVYLALQTGSVEGQENPLTVMNAAKFFEVTKQVVLTAHMIQPLFVAIGKPFHDKLSASQKAVVKAAAVKAAKFNDDARLADEKQVADRLRGLGLRVDTIDTTAFRAKANEVYAKSDIAKKWDQKLMQQAIDTK